MYVLDTDTLSFWQETYDNAMLEFLYLNNLEDGVVLVQGDNMEDEEDEGGEEVSEHKAVSALAAIGRASVTGERGRGRVVPRTYRHIAERGGEGDRPQVAAGGGHIDRASNIMNTTASDVGHGLEHVLHR